MPGCSLAAIAGMRTHMHTLRLGSRRSSLHRQAHRRTAISLLWHQPVPVDTPFAAYSVVVFLRLSVQCSSPTEGQAARGS